MRIHQKQEALILASFESKTQVLTLAFYSNLVSLYNLRSSGYRRGGVYDRDREDREDRDAEKLLMKREKNKSKKKYLENTSADSKKATYVILETI